MVAQEGEKGQSGGPPFRRISPCRAEKPRFGLLTRERGGKFPLYRKSIDDTQCRALPPAGQSVSRGTRLLRRHAARGARCLGGGRFPAVSGGARRCFPGLCFSARSVAGPTLKNKKGGFHLMESRALTTAAEREPFRRRGAGFAAPF